MDRIRTVAAGTIAYRDIFLSIASLAAARPVAIFSQVLFAILVAVMLGGCDRPQPSDQVKQYPQVPPDSTVTFGGDLTGIPDLTLASDEAANFVRIINAQPRRFTIPQNAQYPKPYARFRVAGRDYDWYGEYVGVELRQGETTIRLAWYDSAFDRMFGVLKRNGFRASESVYKDVVGALGGQE